MVLWSSDKSGAYENKRRGVFRIRYFVFLNYLKNYMYIYNIQLEAKSNFTPFYFECLINLFFFTHHEYEVNDKKKTMTAQLLNFR